MFAFYSKTKLLAVLALPAVLALLAVLVLLVVLALEACAVLVNEAVCHPLYSRVQCRQMEVAETRDMAHNFC